MLVVIKKCEFFIRKTNFIGFIIKLEKTCNVCDGVMKVSLVITDLKIKICQTADLVVNN